jgi:hypothetical protein
MPTLKGMDTHDIIATPEQQRAHRRDMGQRLRDQVERLLRSLEALPEPTTVAEAERAAKALKAVEAVVTQVCGKEARAPEKPEEITEEQDILATWRPVLDRRLAYQAQLREALKAQAASEAPEPDKAMRAGP